MTMTKRDICAHMPGWIARVEAALAAGVPATRNDIVADALRRPPALDPTPRGIVEYLMQQNQWRRASMPWPLDLARRWLDGDDDIFVFSNMERAFAEDAEIQRAAGRTDREIREDHTRAIHALARMGIC